MQKALGRSPVQTSAHIWVPSYPQALCPEPCPFRFWKSSGSEIPPLLRALSRAAPSSWQNSFSWHLFWIPPVVTHAIASCPSQCRSLRRVLFHLHLNATHPLGSVRGQLDHPFLMLQAKKASSDASYSSPDDLDGPPELSTPQG